MERGITQEKTAIQKGEKKAKRVTSLLVSRLISAPEKRRVKREDSVWGKEEIYPTFEKEGTFLYRGL